MNDFNIDDSIGYLINKTAFILKYELQQVFKPYDVTPQQWALLNRLWLNDGIPQSQLAEMTRKDRPNTTRIIDRLEEKGLVQRKSDPNDRRIFMIFLTDKGQSLKDQLVPLAVNLLEKSLQGIPQKELIQVKTVLNKIYNNLE